MTGWERAVASGLVEPDVEIGTLTTYKLGGPARWFAEPADRIALERLLELVDDASTPILVIGRGSNLVVADRGFDGLVIRLGRGFSELEIGQDAIDAGAAVSLPVLARAAGRAGKGGLEFFVGIPGSVGGAVVMNAGCFGTETADVLITAEILDVPRRTVRAAGPRDLAMAYRSTNLAADDVVLSAGFRVDDVTPAVADRRMREITRWRKEHQPGGTLNAGSVFKNPVGDAAGRIIDSLGLKGFGPGRVRVSERHANFFVAEPGATAQDVWDLVHGVRDRVFEATGVQLEPEIRFAGSFDPRDGAA